jgi:hypothetical protein
MAPASVGSAVASAAPRRSTPRAQRSESFGARVAARELPLPTLLRRSIMSLAMTAIGRQPKFRPPRDRGHFGDTHVEWTPKLRHG